MAPLASVSDLEQYLPTALDDDALGRAAQALDLATGLIQSYTGQDFELVEDDTISVWPKGSTVLLPQLPVLAVSAVTVDGEATTDWTLEPNGILRLSAAWSESVTVTYDHGFTVIPPAVKSVCLQIAARSFAGDAAIRSESVGSYSVTYRDESSFSTDERAILNRFRVPTLA